MVRIQESMVKHLLTPGHIACMSPVDVGLTVVRYALMGSGTSPRGAASEGSMGSVVPFASPFGSLVGEGTLSFPAE